MKRFICLVSILLFSVVWGDVASADTATSQMGIYFTSIDPADDGNGVNTVDPSVNKPTNLPALNEGQSSNWMFLTGLVMISCGGMLLSLKKKEKEGM